MSLIAVSKEPHVINADDLPIKIPDEWGDEEAFLEAPELHTIAATLIDTKPLLAHLVGADIYYCWKQKGGSHKGEPIYGTAMKLPALARHFAEAHYLIWLAADHLLEYPQVVSGFLDRALVERLLMHELLHLGWNPDKGEIIMVDHDFTGFLAELREYGPWHGKLQAMAVVMKQLKLPL